MGTTVAGMGWFRSTPPRGRRPYGPAWSGASARFRSTPPRGRRPTSPTPTCRRLPFRSTPPRGRRRPVLHLRSQPGRVSIHASAREATLVDDLRLAVVPVSIHASAREATHRLNVEPGVIPVSIHASAREATRRGDPHDPDHAGFDPRLRAGGDRSRRRWPVRRPRFDPRLRAGGD